MASPPAPAGWRGWLHVMVAWQGLPTPRIAGLALDRRMYLAGSLLPIVFDRHSVTETPRHSFFGRCTFISILPTLLASRQCSACVAQDVHSLILILDSICSSILLRCLSHL